jgi:hypothetical protein
VTAVVVLEVVPALALPNVAAALPAALADAPVTEDSDRLRVRITRSTASASAALIHPAREVP